MALGSSFPAAHLQNLSELCKPPRMSDRGKYLNIISGSWFEASSMANIIFKKHEISSSLLLKFKKWSRAIRSWANEEDSEDILRRL
jgi:hypothetical protein